MLELICILLSLQALFKLEDKQLRRAGLDYHEFADLKIYKNFAEFYQENKDKQI